MPHLPLPGAVDEGRLRAIRRMDEHQGRVAAARELEVTFFTQLIGALRRTIPDGGIVEHGPERDVLEDLFDRELAQALVAGDPLGLVAELADGHAAGARRQGGTAARREVTASRGAPQAGVRAYATVRAVAVPADSSATGARASVAPVHGRISSPYGPRRDPVSGGGHMHGGIDFAAPRGTPVRAVAAGRVVASGWAGSAGRRVVIEHAGGYSTVYAHASRTLVRKDEGVVAGQVIATVGSSGRATGPHLHFEVHRYGVPMDPARAELTAVAVRRAVSQQTAQATPVKDR